MYMFKVMTRLNYFPIYSDCNFCFAMYALDKEVPKCLVLGD